MVRLHFVVEGQTEEEFINSVLSPHLHNFSVISDARCVYTRRRRGITEARGGLVSFGRASNDLTLWMREDPGPDSFFTTMFDYYGLPCDFPGRDEASARANPRKAVEALEAALATSLEHPRFIPHIQLHEFEALLFTDISKLAIEFISSGKEIRELTEIAGAFASPEDIDSGRDTAPSKRIIQKIPAYQYRKSSAGPRVASEIGLPAIRAACAHFNQWLSTLEKLGTDA